MYIPLTACKQYCLAAGATQDNIAYTQNVSRWTKNKDYAKRNEHNKIHGH